MLLMVKLIMHRHVRITTFCSRLPAWLTSHGALSFSLIFDMSRCRTLYHPLRRRCRCVNWPSFSSLMTAVHFPRTTGPSKSPSTSSMCTTPATRCPTATQPKSDLPAQLRTLHQVSLDRCHGLVFVRHREPQQPSLTSSRRPTLARCLSVARSMAMK